MSNSRRRHGRRRCTQECVQHGVSTTCTIISDTLAKVTRKVLVDGRELTIRANGGEYEIDGVNGTFSSVETEPGVFSLLMDGRSFEVLIEGGSTYVNRRRFETWIVDPRAFRRPESSAQAQGPQRLIAAMPGKVVRILTPEGTAVEAGGGILVVEAMKMQNEVKTPRTGVVTSIAVREGAAVSAGDVLAIIE